MKFTEPRSAMEYTASCMLLLGRNRDRMRWVGMVAVGLLFSVRVEAQAPASESEDDVTIYITATPPVSASSPSGVSSEPQVSARGTDTVPEPVVRSTDSGHGSVDTPEAIAASWNRRFAIGATVGVGSPLGLAGAWLDVNVSRWVGITGGAGLGGTFGPAVGFGIQGRLGFWDRWGVYTGIGLSTNFTLQQYLTHPALRAPSNSWWTNFEAGVEYRARSGVLVRGGVGYALLLNTGDFENRESMGYYGPRGNVAVGYDPVSAADAHDQGLAFGMLYTHLDVGYLFDF